MTVFDQSNHAYQIVVAVFLGVFIGLRSETDIVARSKKVGSLNIAGVRTMTLLVVLGTLSTFFERIPYLSLVLFIGMMAFLLIAYSNGVFRLKRYGLTTEVSAIIAYLIGVLIGFEQMILAILLSVLLGMSSAYKAHIHKFADSLSLREWSGALQLLVISALVLPLLPREPVDPWGVFVPFDIWVLVIVLAAIGFLGYFFSKYTDERRSTLATSFLGALVSSTAVTTSIAHRSKRASREMTTTLLSGIMIAIAVMQLRVLVEIAFLSPIVAVEFFAPAAAMFVVASVFAVYYHMLSRTATVRNAHLLVIESPFELLPAVRFALFFTAVLFAIHFMGVIFGEAGAYATTLIAAFADVDVIVFSTLLTFQKGLVDMHLVTNILAIAVIVNTAVKLIYIAMFGSRAFLVQASGPLAITVLIGIFAAVLI